MNQSDIRETALFREVELAAGKIWHVNSGTICDAAELDISPCGHKGIFTATVVDALSGTPGTRICQVDLKSGALSEIVGPQVRPRLPSHAPTGNSIAYLADPEGNGCFRLEIKREADALLAPSFNGWVDQFSWSADGRSLSVLVAEHGADRAGIQGAVQSAAPLQDKPAWLPDVRSCEGSGGERRLWIVGTDDGGARPLGSAGLNVWEAAWCGPDANLAIVSEGASEGDWYSARLARIGLRDGTVTTLFEPANQLGSPRASPSGRRVAVIEAVCSDRLVVAGSIVLIEPDNGSIKKAETSGVDVTNVTWLDEDRILFAGHRGFETAVGLLDASTGKSTIIWTSTEIGVGGAFATVAPIGRGGDFALVGEGFRRPPEIAVVEAGKYRVVREFVPQCALDLPIAEPVEWQAPDGLELEGWLLRPHHEGPYATVLNVHGGPVWHWRQRWLGRFVGFQDLMLVARGFAVFLPNPRGSTGRGEQFAALVRGDVGGDDTRDYLSGIDHLIDRGIADPNRLGVCGGSYGGYMAAWLVTQDQRFACAVSVAPIINPVTEHLLSSVPHFTRLFFDGDYGDLKSNYFARSPLLHVGSAKTPTLVVCGARDRVTPPEEAAQFHAALVEHGVESVLVTYPEEGHGVRSWPAIIDYVARLIEWFERHMPASTGQ